MNNRVIKFRAWDKSECQMTISETLPRLMAQDSLPECWIKDMDFLQFTGLHDKNGVEIYEGDIVRTTVDKHWWLYVIGTSAPHFGNNLCALTFKHNVSIEDDLYTYQEVLVELGSVRGYIPSGKGAEVIGNIHENPELLESKS